jgi:hypothetical protein
MTSQGHQRRATYDDDDVDMSLVVLTEEVVSISELIGSQSSGIKAAPRYHLPHFGGVVEVNV